MHVPVLLREVLEYLDPSPGEFFVDGTLGGGGHAREILKNICPGGTFLGLDMDEKVLEAFEGFESCPDEKVVVRSESYANISSLLQREGLGKPDGILVDLGLSSIQLDDPERGFSFRVSGPLDMRFSVKSTLTAAHVVNTYPERELERVFREYGEERYTRRIVGAIVRSRKEKRIQGTDELRDLIMRAIPPKGAMHSVARIFQALRIEVNGELENLENFLESFPNIMASGGRAGVISFHSLEDRMVKQAFQKLKRFGRGEILTKKPIIPSDLEMEKNPRSRSAKLRVFKII